MAGKSNKKRRFVGLPYNMVSTRQFASLSSKAVKLLIDLSLQRNGHNNGKLSACWTLMKQRGWKSSASVYRARKELIDAGFLIITRTGLKKRGHATLVAVTWDGIDDCCVDYDAGITPSNIPLSYWCKHPSARKALPKLRAVNG